VPTIHLQLAGETQLPTGKHVAVSSSQALVGRGPVIQVAVGLERSMSTALLSTGGKVPTPVNGIALLDTGVSTTCVDNSVAAQLSLPVVDTMKMTSASHEAVDQPAYPINVEIIGTPIQFSLPKAMGANLATQRLSLLIGRDALALFTVFYNGPTGQITLSI
jgi:predicted aspartyl protease